MAHNDCKDAGDAGIRDCKWRRLQVCCGLWGGACRYLGSVADPTGGRHRMDVRNRSLAASSPDGNAPHPKGINAGSD